MRTGKFILSVISIVFCVVFFHSVFHNSSVSHQPMFAWTLNMTRNVSMYLRLTESTALLEPKMVCTQPPPDLLIVVISAPNNTQERNTIRNTWGRWTQFDANLKDNDSDLNLKSDLGSALDPSPFPLVTPVTFTSRIIFLLGAESEESIDSVTRFESEQYGDILVERFHDSYTNLTLKSLFMLKWVTQSCHGIRYLMKVDDDVFLHVPNLMVALGNAAVKPPLLMGSLICGAKPIHNPHSKWYAPERMYPTGGGLRGKGSNKGYPNYLSGTGYVLSADTLQPLLLAAARHPYFHLEDIFITGICARAIGARPTDHIGFSYHKRPKGPCIYARVITGHETSPAQMTELWIQLNDPYVMGKCPTFKNAQLREYGPGKCVWR